MAKFAYLFLFFLKAKKKPIENRVFQGTISYHKFPVYQQEISWL